MFGCASDFHARRTQQSIAHPETATIFLDYLSVHLAIGFFSIDRLMQLGIKLFANRMDRFYTRTRQCSFEVRLDTTNAFENRFARCVSGCGCFVRLSRAGSNDAINFAFACRALIGRTIQALPRFVSFTLQLLAQLLETRLDSCTCFSAALVRTSSSST